MTLALAPVASTASTTVLNTGTPSTCPPAFPGVTPRTIFVPYSSICRVWKAPTEPVIPCTRTFVLLSTQMLIVVPPSFRPDGGGHDFFRRVLHIGRRNDIQFRCGEDLLPLLHVGPFLAHDKRDLEAEDLDGLHNSLGDHVAPHDAAEDVDQDRLYVRVGDDQPECVGHLLGGCPPSHVEEVCRRPAAHLDHVHRRHRESRSVDHATDVPVEPDVGEVELGRLGLHGVLLAEFP